MLWPFWRLAVIYKGVEIVNTVFEERLEQLLVSMQRLHEAFDRAGIAYEVIGGMAALLHVDRVDPILARLTRDIDVAIRRTDLDQIRDAVRPFGLTYRHVEGVDMLLDANQPKARSAIHLIMAGERVRPDYPEPTPEIGTGEMIMGARITSIDHLLTMKLTSFRLKDQVHVQDLDGAGLITKSMEDALSPLLQERLAQVRASE